MPRASGKLGTFGAADAGNMVVVGDDGDGEAEAQEVGVLVVGKKQGNMEEAVGTEHLPVQDMGGMLRVVVEAVPHNAGQGSVAEALDVAEVGGEGELRTVLRMLAGMADLPDSGLAEELDMDGLGSTEVGVVDTWL